MRHCRVLDERDRDRVARIVDADPVVNCFLASRVDAGVLAPGGVGEVWGYPRRNPYALLHLGANCVPVNMDAEARAAFVDDLGRWRNFIAMVGPASDVLGLWHALCERWGESYEAVRVMRPRQLLMARSAASDAPADPRLRLAVADDFDSYFRAAAAMYHEELEEDPLITNPVGYRTYVRSLIEQRRAFTIVEGAEVVFKADLGAMSSRVAQVQGVWVKPELRGRGLSVGGMAGVTDAIVASGRTASLYVNDFNAPAVATYRRCGYAEVGALASVLF
ncbi:GNAT family N-acetyltransferase [Propioniciclava soli]|uniref:GNAT family N-acetyltransferase n=1 Tax=Propioniciclava soli TaxID=2775081 RepID=A0ABZ3CA67_9ACTN|nr:GNAT family N-acetyltransferase [Propioniciclava soli]